MERVQTKAEKIVCTLDNASSVPYLFYCLISIDCVFFMVADNRDMRTKMMHIRTLLHPDWT